VFGLSYCDLAKNSLLYADIQLYILLRVIWLSAPVLFSITILAKCQLTSGSLTSKWCEINYLILIIENLRRIVRFLNQLQIKKSLIFCSSMIKWQVSHLLSKDLLSILSLVSFSYIFQKSKAKNTHWTGQILVWIVVNWIQSL